MAFNLFSRVRETTITTGTGTYTLAGAVAGHRAFNASGCYANGDTFFALIVAGAEWELIKGTWNTGGTVSRTQVYKSTNSDNAVNWGAGTKEIFVCFPAAGDLDAAGRVLLNAALGSVGGIGYSALTVETSSAAGLSITATAIALLDSAGNVHRATSVSLSANIAVSGANGLDAGAEASDTWYSIWVIYNPATATLAALLSTSATSPTLPSGYTYKARVGWVRNDGSAFRQFVQKGNRVQNTGAVTVLETYSDIDDAEISIAEFVPSTVAFAQVLAQTPNILDPAHTHTIRLGPTDASWNVSVVGANFRFQVDVWVDNQTIYYVSTKSNVFIYVVGYTDNL
jgi:hypothetical protein